MVIEKSSSTYVAIGSGQVVGLTARTVCAIRATTYEIEKGSEKISMEVKMQSSLALKPLLRPPPVVSCATICRAQR